MFVCEYEKFDAAYTLLNDSERQAHKVKIPVFKYNLLIIASSFKSPVYDTLQYNTNFKNTLFVTLFMLQVLMLICAYFLF